MKKILLLTLVLIFISLSCLAQNNNFEITVGMMQSKSIKLGESHNYKLKLNENQFALINLKQKGIDLKVSTFGPDGREIEEFDSPNGNDGYEIVLIDAKTSGLFGIKVSPLGESKRPKKGNYEIELIAINSSVKAHLDEVLKNLYNRNHIPGFGVGILNSKKILYKNAKGYANIENKIPYTTKTVQNIASISKTFISLSLMILVEQNKFSLDTPINKLLPFKVINPYYPNSPITIRHLATHTSTINEKSFYNKAYILLDKKALDKYDYKKYFLKELKYALNNKEIPMSDFLQTHLAVDGKDFEKNNFFKAKPGENWYYSNVGAALAAYLIEYVTSVSYDEFVKSNIIIPLGLKSACWSGNINSEYKVATQYDIKGNPLPNRTIITYPDGELYINIDDLSKYLMTFIKGNIGVSNIISANSYKEIMKVQHEQITGDFKGRKDGIFWEFSKSGVMGHSGGDFGVSSFMYFNPITNIGFTYFCNIMPTESDYSNAESRAIWSVLKRYSLFFQ